jgi:hypothetical protein
MATDPARLDASFAALQAFDWGRDAAALQAIDAEIIATHGDAAARLDLERRLADLLAADTTRATREYVCRKLAVIGTAASVPALASLLAKPEHSHMARFALERSPAPEAAAALRAALESAPGDLRIGMITSLAARGDAASVPALARLLTADARTAAVAAEALGRIASPEAAAALARADSHADASVAAAIVDARLGCAESLLGQGRREEALAMYRAVEKAIDARGAAAATPAARAAKLAATRGILACLDSSTPS